LQKKKKNRHSAGQNAQGNGRIIELKFVTLIEK
jgi:hypothetical protein